MSITKNHSVKFCFKDLIPKYEKKQITIDNQTADYKIFSDNPDTYTVSYKLGKSIFYLIFGKHINGGFCGIINKNVSCELSDCSADKLYNTEKISKIIKSERSVNSLVNIIADEDLYTNRIAEAKEISVDFNGNNYLIIFGRNKDYKTDFCIIPNWKTSVQILIDDINVSERELGKIIKDKNAVKVIAEIMYKEMN